MRERLSLFADKVYAFVEQRDPGNSEGALEALRCLAVAHAEAERFMGRLGVNPSELRSYEK